MAGSNVRRKKSSSILSMFKSCCSSSERGDIAWEVEQGGYNTRIWPSDEDRGYWVAEPGIDRRASAFIAKFHDNSRF